MSKKQKRKLKKLMKQWWRDYGSDYVKKWLLEYDRRMLLDGEVFINKKGQFVEPSSIRR